MESVKIKQAKNFSIFPEASLTRGVGRNPLRKFSFANFTLLLTSFTSQFTNSKLKTTSKLSTKLNYPDHDFKLKQETYHRVEGPATLPPRVFTHRHPCPFKLILNSSTFEIASAHVVVLLHPLYGFLLNRHFEFWV